MKIKNINPCGAGYVAALDMRLVGAGEVVDVAEDVAALLLVQSANWELVEKAKAAVEFAAKVIADHAVELAAASGSPLAFQPADVVAQLTDNTGEGESL